jgi:hypothetical protein
MFSAHPDEIEQATAFNVRGNRRVVRSAGPARGGMKMCVKDFIDDEGKLHEAGISWWRLAGPAAASLAMAPSRLPPRKPAGKVAVAVARELSAFCWEPATLR